MASSTNWRIGITAQNNVSPALNDIQNKLNSFTKGLKMVGGVMAGAFAVNKIADFGKECLDAYRTQLRAEDQLNQALKRRGVYTDELSQQFKDVASQQQKIGVIGDEVSLQAMQKAMDLGLNEQDASGMLGLLQDVSVAVGGIEGASEKLPEVMTSYAEALNKGKVNASALGFQMTDNERKQFKSMSYDERKLWLNQKLAKYQGENARASETSLGKQIQMQNNIGDAYEKIGQAIDKVLTPIVVALAPAIENVCNWVAELSDEFTGSQVFDSSTWEDLQTVWEGIKRVLEPVFEGIKTVIGGLLDVIKGIVEFIAGVFTGDWDKAWNGIKDIFKGVVEVMGGLFQGFVNGVLQGFAEMIGAGKEWSAERERLKAQADAGGTNIDLSGSVGGKKGEPNATGTSYFGGGLAEVGEHGGEILNLPNGTQIIPNDISKKMTGGYTVNCPVTIQGNVIGNDDFINQIGNAITAKVQLAISNC